MEILHNIKVIVHSILAWLVYGLSFVFPREKKLWVVMGWRMSKHRELFGDNAKYFFLYVANNLPKDIKVVWIGRDNDICQILRQRGYQAYNLFSLAGVWTSLRAGYTIVDANIRLENWQYSGGSRLIQLWHGKSLKKMGHNSPYAMGRYKKFSSPNLFRKFYLLTAASKFLGDFNVSGFRINPDDLVVTGLPRYDVLFESVKDSDIDIDLGLKDKLERLKKEYKKIVFYAPTFRPDGSNPLVGVDLNSLNSVLAEANYYCLISLHPKFANKDWQPKEKFSHLDFVETGFDLYPLMNKFDLLITDYSSLALDFLLVKVPAILYIYDLESFEKGMGIHQEIADALPGPRVENFDRLLEVLKGDTYNWSEQHDQARNTFFTYQDNKSAQRITNILLEVLATPGQTIAEARKYLEN